MENNKFKNELWEIPNAKWELKEDYVNESSNKSVADGVNVLAVVQGVFFVPDGVSRNERFYPKTFWETILINEDLQRRINDKTMFGCIGHEDRGISESDITEGKISHIVTKLWIDPATNMGMGEAHILGTTAGRNLYIIMKAGSKIKVSSRASGEYKPNENYNGMPIVDENNYYLETFDFVLNPGFTETNPLIKENMKKIKEEMRRQEMEFSQKIYEDLRDEKKTLSEEIIKIREEKAVSEANLKSIQEEVVKKDAEITRLSEELVKKETELADKEAISEELTSIKNVLKDCEIEDLSTLKEDLEKSGTLLESYVKLGKPEQIQKKISKLSEETQKWEELGNYEDIVESIPVIEYVLEETVNLGIPLSEVKEIIARADHLVKEEKQKQNEELILSISREYKAPIENVRSMLESLGEVQTVEILKALDTKNKKIVKEEAQVKEKKQVETKKETVNEDKPHVYSLFKQYRNEKNNK